MTLARKVDRATPVPQRPQLEGRSSDHASTPPNLAGLTRLATLAQLQQPILNLQAIAGNGAVQHFLGRTSPSPIRTGPTQHLHGPVVQTQGHHRRGRKAPVTPAPPPAPRPAPEIEGLKAARPRIEKILADTDERYQAVTNFVDDGLVATNAATETLVDMTDRYEDAYGRYDKVLREAEQAEKNRQEMIDAVIGIGIGVALGLGAGWAAPALKMVSTAEKVLAEAMTEYGEFRVAGKFKSADKSHVFEPPREIRPDYVKLQVWMQLAGLYKDLATVSAGTKAYVRTIRAAEFTLGEVKAYTTGGHGDLALPELERRVAVLEQAGAVPGPEADLASAKASFARMQKDANAQAATWSVRKMEQDIWIHWIGKLRWTDVPDTLDIDEIEDHLHSIGVLGAGSRLGVDFGSWTSEDDTLAAAKQANRESLRLTMIGQQAVVYRRVFGKTVYAVHPTAGRILTWSLYRAMTNTPLKPGDVVQVVGTAAQMLVVEPTGGKRELDQKIIDDNEGRPLY